MRIWGAQNVELVSGPSEGYTAWLWPVVFSPDSTHIASGSIVKTISIRILDAQPSLSSQGKRHPVHYISYF